MASRVKISDCQQQRNVVFRYWNIWFLRKMGAFLPFVGRKQFIVVKDKTDLIAMPAAFFVILIARKRNRSQASKIAKYP
jgi:hypothetical protein